MSDNMKNTPLNEDSKELGVDNLSPELKEALQNIPVAQSDDFLGKIRSQEIPSKLSGHETEPLTIKRFIDDVANSGGLDVAVMASIDGFDSVESWLANGVINGASEESIDRLRDGNASPQDILLIFMEGGQQAIDEKLTQDGKFSMERDPIMDKQAASLLAEYDILVTDDNITSLLVADEALSQMVTLQTQLNAPYNSAADEYCADNPDDSCSVSIESSPVEVIGPFNSVAPETTVEPDVQNAPAAGEDNLKLDTPPPSAPNLGSLG